VGGGRSALPASGRPRGMGRGSRRRVGLGRGRRPAEEHPHGAPGLGRDGGPRHAPRCRPPVGSPRRHARRRPGAGSPAAAGGGVVGHA
ncbi:MAG: hypothetical protein AVDCRST_MAG10-626, partial [uncultured Acidimicrobiales bacterium]